MLNGDYDVEWGEHTMQVLVNTNIMSDLFYT